MQQLLAQLAPLAKWPPPTIEFLQAKDRAQRRLAFIQTERLWFNKFGWFMARVVTFFGLLVLGWALLSRGLAVDFITALLLGAAGYYLLLMTLANWRYRNQNRKRLKLVAQESARYQREIVLIVAALMRQYQLDPSHYPIVNPKCGAGLEERADGYYVPLE